MQPRGLARFMALPSPLRRVVLDAVFPPPPSPCPRQTTTIRLILCRRLATTLPPLPHDANSPRPVLSYLPSPSNQPDPTANPAPAPDSRLLDRATTLFLEPVSKFLYSAPRFLNLPMNTHTPEVCILGRSNVGKSTLLNALAGLETRGRAGRSHGARTSRPGLAITSAKAGCTKMMNGYGFGPPLRLGPGGKGGLGGREEDDDNDNNNNNNNNNNSGGRNAPLTATRSQRRRAIRGGEPPPRYSLVLLDMPGYGHMSRSEWGVEIGKYLGRRTALRGAVLLVDALAGVKDGDRLALGLLRDANVPTAIVVTKADKLLSSPSPSPLPSASSSSHGEAAADIASGEEQLRQSCLRIWEELRAIDGGSPTWTEGQGWEPEIFVTGAGDPKSGALGVAGARLAICRLAGLVREWDEEKAQKKKHGRNAKIPSSALDLEVEGAGDDSGTAGRKDTIVPFDQIRWADETVRTLPVGRTDQPGETPGITIEPKQGGRVKPWKRRRLGGLEVPHQRATPAAERASF